MLSLMNKKTNIVIPDAGYVDGVAQEQRIQELSEDQEKALDFVDNFMKSSSKYTVIGGCAGSGKSSIIPYIVNKYEGCCVCAYTGKAVMVLKRKGIVDVCTLHSFLYEVKTVTNEETLEKTIVYEPKKDHFFYGVELLIVDEASMVDKEMFDLIKSKKFKTLYIGDHFQLPPVGDSFNIMLKPNFKMEKILRQNEDNHIIRLAEMARNGQKIPLGIYGNSKHTLKFDKEELLNYDEIITWTNKTKDMINEKVREQLGYPKDIPQIDDKMIVRVNCRAKNVFNGQIVYIMNNPKLSKNGAWKIEFVDELTYNDPFIMAQTDEYTKAYASVHLSKEELDRLRTSVYYNQSYNNKFKMPTLRSPYQVHLDWGYAITAHAAQGSSWKNVAVMLDKRIYRLKDCYRWIYTAITRAEESVVIYSGDF